jgi:hypothetical protein
MREWLKVVIGVAALVIIPTVPAFYVEYLWVISRDHYPPEARGKNDYTERDQRDARPFSAPNEPATDKNNQTTRAFADQASDPA